MKKTIWGFLLFFTFAAVCFAQQNDSNNKKNGENIILKAGTLISAQLQNNLDIETAKNNDNFILKLMEDIVSGDFKIEKGSELLGGVVRAKKAANEEDTSEISIYFDFIKNGDDYMPFKAIVKEITDNKTTGIKMVASPVFKGATVISAKGKGLRLDEGTILKLELSKDLMKP